MEGMNNKLGKLNKVELKDKEVEPMWVTERLVPSQIMTSLEPEYSEWSDRF